MRIEYWADVVNPWTFVVSARVRAAVAQADARTPVEVVWRPLLADPADPEAPRDALRVLALAEAHGGAALQGRVAERLGLARGVRDRAEVVRAAGEAGFPQAAALLESDAGVAELQELLLIGKARGITVSPTLAAAGRVLEFAMSETEIAAFIDAAAIDAARTAPAEPAVSPDDDAPTEVDRLRWAQSLLDLRDPLGALVLLRPLLAEHGDDPNVRRLAAAAYFASAQLSRARDLLEATVAADPHDSYCRLMLGRTLQRLGRAEEAATHLRIAAAMSPEYA